MAELTPSQEPKHWYQGLTRYQWFVLLVASLGWMFDCLDQQIFVLTRPDAMKDLLQVDSGSSKIGEYGAYATSIFLAGWAMGGVFFGVLGDRIGRAKTMLITILLYSLCTGLSALSTSFYDFAFYRFITGLGVGGEFAVGVALVAEVLPARSRPYALALLQALSAVGNIAAALLSLSFGFAQEEGIVGTAEQGALGAPWRWLYVIGALPALLTVVIRAKLKEPESWQRATHDGASEKKLGSYSALFSDPVWRKRALFGLLLGTSGIMGIWGVGFFAPDLMKQVQRPRETQLAYENGLAAAKAAGNANLVTQYEYLNAHLPEALAGQIPKGTADEAIAESKQAIDGRLTRWQGYTSLFIQVGAFFGMFSFGVLGQKIGRRPTFALAFVAAFAATAMVFWTLSEFWQMFFMLPIMGFCQLSLVSGFAVYFPELFPTYLRSTGTSFCYSVGRFVAALAPLAFGQILAAYKGNPESLRYAGVFMCGVFLVGLLALPFLPETKDKPLPE